MSRNTYAKAGLYKQMRGSDFAGKKTSNPVSIGFTCVMVLLAVSSVMMSAF